jgi:2Fe-2S ferredoxin
MKITVTLPDDAVHELDGRPGNSLMKTIREAGLPIRAECGGAMACATCHVQVDEGFIEKTGRAGNEESDLLDMSDYRTDESRLACQIRLHDGLDGLRVRLQLDALE